MRLAFHRKPSEMASALRAAQKGTRNLFWVVYHGRHRMTLRPFGWGFQPTPCMCPKCGRSVREPDDLKYDLASAPAPKVRRSPHGSPRKDEG